MEHNYYLAHHGVKGQKWGIRKKRELSGTRPVKSKKSEHQDDIREHGSIIIYDDPKKLKSKARKNILTAVGGAAMAGLGAVAARQMMTQGDAVRSRKLIALSLAASIAAVGSAGVGVSQLRTAKRVEPKLKELGIES